MTTLAWAELEPKVSALFTRIATVPGEIPSVTGSLSPSVVQARSTSNMFPAPSSPTTLHWHVQKVAPVGRDEIREAYDPDTKIDGDTYVPDPENPDERLGAVIATEHGQRKWTIQVRIESPNQSVPASEHFRAMVDRMRLPSVADELEATGLAYTGWNELTDAEYDGEDGRPISVYIAQLFFNGASFAQDSPVTTIEVADITYNVLPS